MANMNYQLTDKEIDKIKEYCCRVLKIKSLSGEEKDVVAEFKSIFEELAYDDIYIDKYGSIIGTIKGKREGKKVLFDGHIDTVPYTEEQWSVPPLSGAIKDGKIYGRGASDMKGAVSAMISAAAIFAERCDRDFAGEIHISCSVFEELFEGIACREVSEKFNPDYVVIGEASELNLKRGQRGRAEIVLEVFGKPAHSANPQKGINAVLKSLPLIDEIAKLEMPKDDLLVEGLLVLTDIKSLPYPGSSVVPEYCKITYDRRTLVGETKESVIAPIQELIDKMSAEDSEFSAKVSYAQEESLCYTGETIEAEKFFPAWKLDESDEYFTKVYSELKSAGIDSKVSHYSFCTNGSHFAGEKGIKTIGFGPSQEYLAHTIDEHIEIEQLVKGVIGYMAINKAVLLED